MCHRHRSNILRINMNIFPIFPVSTYMVPEVVGTMGMSSASIGMDQGMWNWGANSLIIMFLVKQRKEITMMT